MVAYSDGGQDMDHAGDPQRGTIGSRSELDIELARLKLRLDRLTSHIMFGRLPPAELSVQQHALSEWFAEVSESLLARSGMRLRPYAHERIQLMALQSPALSRMPSARMTVSAVAKPGLPATAAARMGTPIGVSSSP